MQSADMAHIGKLAYFLWIIIFSLVLICNGSSKEINTRAYIVYMGELPKDDDFSAPAYHKTMLGAALGSKRASESLLHSYKRSFNGFVAKLTDYEKQKIESLEGVVSVFASTENHFHTTRSWDFLGFPVGAAQTSDIESDIIIGVLDSGIWPESESFKDVGFSPPPTKWKGICQASTNFSCNNKIIGARSYNVVGASTPLDIPSPRDFEGHGTHTASTAAGGLVSGASLYGLAAGTARGGVPSARIAVYKVCSRSDSCSDANILAGFDDAIADGVDVISVSLGSSIIPTYFIDPVAIGAFHAMASGVLTSASAGNDGPSPRTIKNFSPWLVSVAASTIDRKFLTKVLLGDNSTYEGISVNTFTMAKERYPLIGDCPGGNDIDVNGAIIFCNKSSLFADQVQAAAAGAAGVILQGDQRRDVAFEFLLPASYLASADGAQVDDYLGQTSNPTAGILKSEEANDTLAPFVVSFSSRGPNPISRDILKPDLTAPGVDILAAWSEATSVTGLAEDKRVVPYNIISGTSMSCPHVSAAAAYVKSFNPTWSPAAIRSALMTTASPMSSETNPDAEFAFGSGQINPIKATSPGLVYDLGVADYVQFLCGEGLNTSLLRLITGDNQTECTPSSNIVAYDLNYPSFSVSGATAGSNVSAVFHRTVTNVGSPSSTYKARVTAPPGIDVQVQPESLAFTFVGEMKTFILVVNATVTNDVLSASLLWDDGAYQVRSPIVAWIT